MDDSFRRRELADFLKTRRARLAPEEVGLVRGLRRRTPGLRREEVAELAGLGLAWYTWLEQGRNIRVSEDVLLAIARALKLRTDELEHLLSLGRIRYARQVDDAGVDAAVSPQEQAILEALDPNPAYIRDDCWNLLGSNALFDAATGFRSVDDKDRNLLWLLFMHDSPRRLVADWEQEARFAVSRFRFDVAQHIGEPAVRTLIENLLCGSNEFRKIWVEHDVYAGAINRTDWVHPTLGLLQFDRSTLGLANETSSARESHRLTVMMPVVGTGTAERLGLLLTDRSAKIAFTIAPALRLVGS